MIRFLVAVALLGSTLAHPASSPRSTPPKKEATPAPAPVGSDRTLTITDATISPELRLAPPGSTTTLTFPVDVVPEKVLLVDPKQRLFPPMAQGSTLAVVSKELLAPGASVPLTVTLVDGTQLNFSLGSGESGFDRFVRIELALKERAGADNAQRLKSQVAELQSRLDDCRGAAGDEGLRKLGAVILRQDLTKPDVFTVEKRPSRSGIDKQNRLLVETHYLFRLFDVSYLVFTVENRDPSKVWVLERAELSVTGGSTAGDVKVLGVEQELDVIPPGEQSKVVLAFRVPALEASQRFTLKLVEKNGSRHVELAGLHL